MSDFPWLDVVHQAAYELLKKRAEEKFPGCRVVSPAQVASEWPAEVRGRMWLTLYFSCVVLYDIRTGDMPSYGARYGLSGEQYLSF